LVLGRRPVEAQLLNVDDLVALEDFLFEFLHIGLVHLLDLVVAVQVGLFEVFEFLLEFLELPGDALVLAGYVLVFDFVLLIRIDEVFAQFAVSIGEVLFLSFQFLCLLSVFIPPFS
jgi:hypothetical protein